MPTPEEVIAKSTGLMPIAGKHIIEALDAAGYQINPKMPPNAAVYVLTDSNGKIVEFKPKGDTFEIPAAQKKEAANPKADGS